MRVRQNNMRLTLLCLSIGVLGLALWQCTNGHATLGLLLALKETKKYSGEWKRKALCFATKIDITSRIFNFALLYIKIYHNIVLCSKRAIKG